MASQDSSPPPAFQSWTRRPAISADSPDPNTVVTLPVFPKTPQIKQEIEIVLSKIVMFKHLKGAQRDAIIGSMRQCLFPAGQTVMQEGSMDGEDMFIILDGQLDVFYGTEKAATIGKGRSFGEVALMFNSPRTATIVSVTPVVLYALSRPAFRTILIEESIQQRKRYEDFLHGVPLFKSLNAYEVSRFADALEPEEFPDGHIIMREGQVEDNGKFYIVETGSVLCTKSDPSTGKEVTSILQGEGGYFGEIGLLSNKPRQATVRCVGPTRCLGIARDHFLMVCGPVEDILKRNMENYKSVQQLLSAQERDMDIDDKV